MKPRHSLIREWFEDYQRQLEKAIRQFEKPTIDIEVKINETEHRINNQVQQKLLDVRAEKEKDN